MTATVVLIGLAAGTYGLKAAAPLLLSGRDLPRRIALLADLLPAALLAALVLVSTMTHDGATVIDARLVGLAAAAVALVARAPFILVVVAAATATALTRTLT